MNTRLTLLLALVPLVGCSLSTPGEQLGAAGTATAAGSGGVAGGGVGGVGGTSSGAAGEVSAEGGAGPKVVGGGKLCDGQSVVCEDGFYCDTVSRRCVEPLGAGGSGEQPEPSITCRHGAIKITGIGPVKLSEMAISLWLPWEPHEPGGDAVLFVDGIVISGESSGVSWRNTIEDIGDDEMAFHLVPDTNDDESRDPTIVPADEITSQAWRAHLGCSDDCESDTLEPTECVLRVDGDEVAAWP